MKIIKKIPVKQVLTADSKKQLSQDFQSRYQRYDRECQQLRFEQRKLEKRSDISPSEIEKRFTQEIKLRKEKMNWVEYKLQQLEILPEGSELFIEEVEAIVEVTEGARWDEIYEHQTIVIKDGIVIQAR
ncbi:YlqD family protein [Thalassobacillus devorans]|uniref:YlqD family protein n=1 Tax=Thalassobacillus devorans TaxID=279813 RepID=UPI000A1C9E14|nr:YlqD family protein [Thalassobacillus devorans]